MGGNISTKIGLQPAVQVSWASHRGDGHPPTHPANLEDSLVSFSFNCIFETTNAVTS